MDLYRVAGKDRKFVAGELYQVSYQSCGRADEGTKTSKLGL